jgi:hypothetical protein
MREAKDEAVRQDERNALTYREAVQAIRSLVDDTALDSEAARAKIRQVLTQLQPKAYESRAAAVRDRLLDKGPAIRALLRSVLTNLVMAWTTSRAQTVIDAWATTHSERVSPELLAHISPAHFGNVNFRGTFRFAVDRYRDRVLGPAARTRLAAVCG